MSTASPTLEFQSRFAPAEAPGEIGRLAGYSIRRLLGSGGMGEVYEAEDLALARPVALKVMLGEIALKPEARARFLREARSAAAVVHDHIVRIYQVGEDRGLLFIAMEMLRGDSLAHRLNGQPFEMSDVTRIATEVCSGLAAAHDAGLVHRDIKPANLWLEAGSGRVKILDFGLARSSADGTLTNTGQIFGTPAYIAPEQASGRPADHRADLFSLGCVLYELTTGHRPFRGDNILVMLNSLATVTPPPPHLVNPSVPVRLSSVITRLIEKDPLDRPPSAREVLEMLASSRDATIRPVAMPMHFKESKPALQETFQTSRLRGLLLEADALARRRDFKFPGALHIALLAIITFICLAIGFSQLQRQSSMYRSSSYAPSTADFFTGFFSGFAPMFVISLIITRWYYAWRYRQICQRIRAEFPTETATWGDERKPIEPSVITVLLSNV